LTENLTIYVIESKKKEGRKELAMRFMIDNESFEINRENILNATRDVPRKPFDGRNKYYIELHGSKYPIKQPIHLVTGLPYTGRFGAQDAQRILTKLGFTVHSLPVAKGIEPVRGATTNATTIEGNKKFAITLEQDEDGYIVVSCPVLPGCHSQGRTDEEAIDNIKEAIRGYIASMRRHREPVPEIKEVREIEVMV
jgi:antitoxin HicB